MNASKRIGAVLFALFLVVLPALAFPSDSHQIIVTHSSTPHVLQWLLMATTGVAGAVSILISARNNNGVLVLNSAAAITAQQAAFTQKQFAQVAMGTSDTQALFTHNWGLDNSAPSFGEPYINWWPVLLGSSSSNSIGLTFDITNTNVVKINKNVGIDGTWDIVLHKPQSIGQ
jgi:hypothetical protein